MKLIIRKIAILICLTLSLGACKLDEQVFTKSTYTVTMKPTATAAQEWQTRWLRGIPCRLPCWEGITPGLSTAEEVTQILSKSSVIKHVRPNLAQWLWNNGSDGGYINYDNYITHRLDDEPNGRNIVNTIVPYYDISIKLGDIINSYGPPSHIDVGKVDKNVYVVLIAYVPQGVLFFTYHPEKPTLDANLVLDNPKFFIPTMYGLQRVFASKLELKEWQGFQIFKFYCGNYDYCN